MMVILESVISHCRTYAIYFSLALLLYVAHFLLQFYLFLYTGDHTAAAAYSRCGLTNDLYRFKNISLSKKVIVLNINPRFLLADLICY